MTLLTLAIRDVLALVFISGGSAKLANLTEFQTVLARLGLPKRLKPIALAVIAVEILMALAIISGWWWRFTNFAVLTVAIGFVLVSLWAYHRSAETTCRCFGALSASRFDRRAIARTSALATLALVVALAPMPDDARPRLLWGAGLVLALVTFGIVCFEAARAMEILQRRRATS
jgi:uncharacterized membrane protein YphA (DoxX/SURF4 family)